MKKLFLLVFASCFLIATVNAKSVSGYFVSPGYCYPADGYACEDLMSSASEADIMNIKLDCNLGFKIKKFKTFEAAINFLEQKCSETYKKVLCNCKLIPSNIKSGQGLEVAKTFKTDVACKPYIYSEKGAFFLEKDGQSPSLATPKDAQYFYYHCSNVGMVDKGVKKGNYIHTR